MISKNGVTAPEGFFKPDTTLEEWEAAGFKVSDETKVTKTEVSRVLPPVE